jgi:type II secretory pathway pseudopilin PulG
MTAPAPRPSPASESPQGAALLDTPPEIGEGEAADKCNTGGPGPWLVVILVLGCLLAGGVPFYLFVWRPVSCEWNAKRCLRAYVQAQQEYRKTDGDGDTLHTYATPFTQLYPQVDGFADAVAGVPPRHGYKFQDIPTVSNCLFDWQCDFALCAMPAIYGRTGRHTFIVATNGIIWAKDLGPDGSWVTDYPPDPAAAGWRKVR